MQIIEDEGVTVNISDERPEERLPEEQELRPEEQELMLAEQEEAERQRQAKRRRRTVGTVIDRIFGFVLATLLMLLLFGLGLEYVIVKGPSPAWRDRFVLSMLEDQRTSFVPHVFLSDDEVDQIAAGSHPGQGG